MYVTNIATSAIILQYLNVSVTHYTLYTTLHVRFIQLKTLKNPSALRVSKFVLF